MSAQNWDDELARRLETPPNPVGTPHAESADVHQYVITASTVVDVHTPSIPLHVTQTGHKELSDTVTEFYYRVPDCCHEAFLQWFALFMPHLNLEDITP